MAASAGEPSPPPGLWRRGLLLRTPSRRRARLPPSSRRGSLLTSGHRENTAPPRVKVNHTPAHAVSEAEPTGGGCRENASLLLLLRPERGRASAVIPPPHWQRECVYAKVLLRHRPRGVCTAGAGEAESAGQQSKVIKTTGK